MEWSARLNSAIGYIEDNLSGDINFSQAADMGCYSLSHFQRMFFAVFGVTPSEYARRRRLTLAASELMNGGKVLDIALKYGYESPEAFTRAFRALNGINPGMLRKTGTRLTAFPRFFFAAELKGGIKMDYKIIEKPAFDLVGKGAKFSVSDGEFKSKGRSFWSKYVVSKEYQELAALTAGKFGEATGNCIMSAYLPNEKGDWDPVVNALGIEKTENLDTRGFEVFHIPAATYAEFNCTFKTSSATNKLIYKEWFPSSGYERDNKSDIAAFYQLPWSKTIFVKWWIPIIKKNRK